MATLEKKLQDIKDAGTYRVLPINEGPCDALITLNGKQVINLSSNNYLGFANHPRLPMSFLQVIPISDPLSIEIDFIEYFIFK